MPGINQASPPCIILRRACRIVSYTDTKVVGKQKRDPAICASIHCIQIQICTDTHLSWTSLEDLMHTMSSSVEYVIMVGVVSTHTMNHHQHFLVNHPPKQVHQATINQCSGSGQGYGSSKRRWWQWQQRWTMRKTVDDTDNDKRWGHPTKIKKGKIKASTRLMLPFFSN